MNGWSEAVVNKDFFLTIFKQCILKVIHADRALASARCYRTRGSIQRKLQEREVKSTSAGIPEQCGDLAKVAGGEVRLVVQVNLDLF